MIFPMFLLFVCLPLAELWVLIQVGQTIGAWQTIAALLVMGIVGGWLVKLEGRRTFLELQSTLARGQMPTNELIHGFLILLGGLLMVTPGFVTDVFGLLLVFPPTRFLALRITKHFVLRRIVFKAMVFDNRNFQSHGARDHENIRDVGPSAEPSRGPGHSAPTELL